jgi:hypothetical protein
MSQAILVLAPLIVVVPLLVFWARMFSDMTNNSYLTNQAKYTWTLMFALLNVFAAIYYYVVEYRNRFR